MDGGGRYEPVSKGDYGAIRTDLGNELFCWHRQNDGSVVIFDPTRGEVELGPGEDMDAYIDVRYGELRAMEEWAMELGSHGVMWPCFRSRFGRNPLAGLEGVDFDFVSPDGESMIPAELWREIRDGMTAAEDRRFKDSTASDYEAAVMFVRTMVSGSRTADGDYFITYEGEQFVVPKDDARPVSEAMRGREPGPEVDARESAALMADLDLSLDGTEGRGAGVGRRKGRHRQPGRVIEEKAREYQDQLDRELYVDRGLSY